LILFDKLNQVLART